MLPHRAQLGFFLKNSGSAPLICHDPGDPCREDARSPAPPPRNRLTALLLAPRRLQSGGPAAAPSSAVSLRPPAAPRPSPVGRGRPGPCNAGSRWTRLAPVLPLSAALMQPMHDVTSSRPVVHPSRAGQVERMRADEERGKSMNPLV